MSVPVTSYCPYLTDYLRIDFNNSVEQVIRLQSFLKYFEGYDYVTVNGVFDQATLSAVDAFQAKYGDDVLKPWGINAPTGYVYKTTLGKINQILCGTAIPHVEPAPAGTDTNTLGVILPEVGTTTPLIGQIDVPDNGQNFIYNLGLAFLGLFHIPEGIKQCLTPNILILVLVVLYTIGTTIESLMYKDVLENVRKRLYVRWGTVALGLLIYAVWAYFLNWFILTLLTLVVAGLLYTFFIHKIRKTNSQLPLVIPPSEPKS